MVSVPVGELPEAIARIARPIHGDDELDQLLDLVGHARFVLLGEPTHGTHELYELRAALTRKLIGQRGFTAMLIAGDWPDALRVDRYVRLQGDDDSARAALGAFERFPAWMWRNREIAELVEWLRAFNRYRDPEQRAGFYGLDLYSWYASIRAVLSCLEDTDPSAAEVARARYACFDHAAENRQEYGTQAFFGIAEDRQGEVIEQLVEMQRRHTARSGRAPSGDAWFHAMQHTQIVKNAEAHYRALLGGRIASWNLRDAHMADTLDLVAEQVGSVEVPAKLVVWAHNSHVGDARATAMGDGGQLTLGQLLRHRHPDEVALIGFTTHTGTVACARAWDEPAIVEHVRPSLPGSWEELFHESGVPRFMLTALSIKRVVGALAERLHRGIGVIYRPETERHSHYYEARLADQYDLIVHLDTTQAIEPLGPLASGAAAGWHDAAGTFPAGL